MQLVPELKGRQAPYQEALRILIEHSKSLIVEERPDGGGAISRQQPLNAS